MNTKYHSKGKNSLKKEKNALKDFHFFHKTDFNFI